MRINGNATNGRWYRIASTNTKGINGSSFLLNLTNAYNNVQPYFDLIYIGINSYTRFAKRICSSNTIIVDKIRFVYKPGAPEIIENYVDIHLSYYGTNTLYANLSSMINISKCPTLKDVTEEYLPQGYTEDVVEL